MTDDAHPKANDKSAVAADTAPAGSVLLTEEGELTDKVSRPSSCPSFVSKLTRELHAHQFYALLATVFNRYAKFLTSGGEDEGEDALVKAKTGSMGRPEMNAFAKATNGQGARSSRHARARKCSGPGEAAPLILLPLRDHADLPDEQWEELTTYLDVNADTELTFKGFTALYSLQTGASPRRRRIARTAASLPFGADTGISFMPLPTSCRERRSRDGQGPGALGLRSGYAGTGRQVGCQCGGGVRVQGGDCRALNPGRDYPVLMIPISA